MLLQDLHVIVKVAEFRSITAAATSLDMRTATASAAVKRVEAQLGAELFVRTTRQLRLSAAGERYLPQCQQALELLQQAQLNLQQDQGEVEAQLRLALSSDLGRNQVLDWLDQLTEQHPKISLQLDIGDDTVDFYRDAVDIALRYGPPNDSNLYGFKICDVPRVLCAAPSYLQCFGTPIDHVQLSEHNGLHYQLHGLSHDVWQLQRGDDSFRVKLVSNRKANDGDLVRRWCVAGQGIALKSSLDMATDLLNGTVVPLLPDYQTTATELWLICPSRQSITPAVRALRDHLKRQCEQILSQLKQRQLLPE